MGRMMGRKFWAKKQDIPKGKGGHYAHHGPRQGIFWGQMALWARSSPYPPVRPDAFKLREEPRVSVVFFGDGASNQGTFHESINMAAAWDF